MICFLMPQAPLHMKLCQRLCATRLQDNHGIIKSQNWLLIELKLAIEQFLILKMVQNFTNTVFLNVTPLLFLKTKYFIWMYNWHTKIENFIHCRMASCWAACPSACTCSLLRDVEQLASLASAWPPPTCPAGCNSQPAKDKNQSRWESIAQSKLDVECIAC